MHLTLFNSDHRIILSCTKSVRMLFERRKSNRLKPQDVTYSGQVIPSSSSVKFLDITFRSHFRTVATLAGRRLLKLNSTFSTTYGPSTSTLTRLYKSYIRSLLDYGLPATCVAFHLHPQRQKTAARLPSNHPRQKHVPSQTLVQARNATQPRGTGLHRQSHSRQTQHSQQPQYTTDQELIFK